MAKRAALAVLRVDKDPDTGKPVLVMPARVDFEALSKLEDGALLEVYAYRPRSERQNRFIHVMLGIAAENSPGGWTAEAIKKAVKIKGGWFDGVIVRKGKDLEYNFKSTGDFTKEQMTEFIDQCLNYIGETVCPGMDLTALRREAEDATRRR